MVHIHPQFITDTAGKKLVVLLANEFDLLMEELESLEDVRIFDQAKKEDDGERISAEEVFRTIQENRRKES